MSNRTDYVSVLPSLFDSKALFVTNLNTTGDVWKKQNVNGNPSIYSMGMGLVTSVALGMAMSKPDRQVVSLEGDGSLLLDLSVLSTVGRANVKNLLIICLDNKSYESIGGIPTHTDGFADLVGIARSSGIHESYGVSNHVDLKHTIESHGLSHGKTAFINAVVKESDPATPVTEPTGKLNKYEFLKIMKSNK